MVFSSVNIRLEIEILMPNLTSNDYDKMSIDKCFKSYKRKNLKVAYNLKSDDDHKYENRIIITKV